MSDDQDDGDGLADTPAEIRRNTTGWWIAAIVAVVAVVGAIFILSGVRPSPAKLQAAHDRAAAEAQTDDAAYGAQLAAAHAAQSAQAAAASQARATETAAQAGATTADAAARDASTTQPAPPR